MRRLPLRWWACSIHFFKVEVTDLKNASNLDPHGSSMKFRVNQTRHMELVVIE